MGFDISYKLSQFAKMSKLIFFGEKKKKKIFFFQNVVFWIFYPAIDCKACMALLISHSVSKNEQNRMRWKQDLANRKYSFFGIGIYADW